METNLQKPIFHGLSGRRRAYDICMRGLIYLAAGLTCALVLFLIRIIANQNTLQMATGDAASWFMIKKTTLGYAKTDDLGFLGNTFLHKVYLAT